mmetsp:Transcript_8208/g.17822  ORF Transcript_8208/g.17822 Transcript_8208/m.17822 type:complete len:164 (-) Transcript_8208:368-859(-)
MEDILIYTRSMRENFAKFTSGTVNWISCHGVGIFLMRRRDISRSTRCGHVSGEAKEIQTEKKTDTNSNDALHTVQTTLYHAFCEYFDLYLEALDHELSGGGEAGNEAVALSSDQLSDRKISLTGYLNYRSENDPARPMLRRLYGDTFCERLISEVLFPAGARM